MLALSSPAALPSTPFEVWCATMLCESNFERMTIKDDAPATQPKARILHVKGSVRSQLEPQLYSGARKALPKAVGGHRFIANSVYKTCQKREKPFSAHTCYNRPARAIKFGQKPFRADKCYSRPATASRMATASRPIVKGSVKTVFLRAGLGLGPLIIPLKASVNSCAE